MPGMTAYSSLFKIGKPKAGETLFVSAAAGAVGLVVCQIGKILGLKVVGSAGTDEKVAYLRDVIKIDGAFNYKTEETGAALDKLCPEGIDIYFENVGGETLDAVLPRMKTFGE
jgi:NADPH-dependent curcumin reductase CurA